MVDSLEIIGLFALGIILLVIIVLYLIKEKFILLKLLKKIFAPISGLLKIILSPVFFFMQWLAEENILFTTVKEGTAKAIMRGKSVDRFIMSFAGYHLNDPNKDWYRETITKKVKRDGNEITVTEPCPEWTVLYHGPNNPNDITEEEEQKDAFYDDRPWILRHLGLYWVGWPWANSVYVYLFEWIETTTNKKTGAQEIDRRKEPTDYLFLTDFTYAIVTGGAETRDRLPVDILILTTVAMRNPYKALFSGEDWIRTFTAAVNRHVRNFVASMAYDDLISPEDKKEGVGSKKIKGSNELSKPIIDWSNELSKPIIDLNTALPDEDPSDTGPKGLLLNYGIKIRRADLQSIEFSGSDLQKEELQKAASKAYAAAQQAKATVTEGTATAQMVALLGEKQAEALAKRLATIKDSAEAGTILAGLDAIREAAKNPGTTVIWANSPFRELFETLSNKGGKS